MRKWNSCPPGTVRLATILIRCVVGEKAFRRFRSPHQFFGEITNQIMNFKSSIFSVSSHQNVLCNSVAIADLKSSLQLSNTAHFNDLKTEKIVIWNWWFDWWLHQNIGIELTPGLSSFSKLSKSEKKARNNDQFSLVQYSKCQNKQSVVKDITKLLMKLKKSASINLFGW